MPGAVSRYGADRVALVWHLHLGGQVIRTTAEHPFYAAGKGWVGCHELQIGDLLLAEDGTRVAVEDLLDTGELETVYNLRVADHHTYFVGCQEWGFSVWAHNADCHIVDYLRQIGITDEGKVKAILAASKEAEPQKALSRIMGKYPGRVREVMERGRLRPDQWAPPVGMNGPSAKYGKWTGDRLNSGWHDSRPEVQKIVKGEPIPFVEGKVDFSKWVDTEFKVPGVKGGRAARNADTDLIYKAIFEREGLGKAGEVYSVRKHEKLVTGWLKDKKLSPHHAGGERIQYVPSDLHKVQHTEVGAYIPPGQQ